MEPKRVLQIIGSMDMGGAETMIMNIYRHIDREKIQFDFLVNVSSGYYEKEILALGGRIFRTAEKSKHPLKYMRDVRRIVKREGYDTVHAHASNSLVALALYAAKRGGAKKRVCHSHNSTGTNAVIQKLMRVFVNRFVTQRCSCSYVASVWMYGSRADDAVVVPVPVDCDANKFDLERYKKIRGGMGISDENVYGHIGRMSEQKNQLFLIDIFARLATLDEKAKLVLVGTGELYDEVREKAKAAGLERRVIFLGRVDDIAEIMNSFDCLIFPSLYEGFPAVLLESQASGIPAFSSDRITDEIVITDLIHATPLELSADEWAAKIHKEFKKNTDRREAYNDSIRKTYDVNNISRQMEEIYIG